MDKHEEKYCPKCNNTFTCKMGDIANCQCNAIQISENTTQFLENAFYDCLCKSCLQKIDQNIKASKRYHFPTQKEMFIEGLHYYLDNNNWVFTELYHTLRGFCCQNGCRHCVYGFKKQEKEKAP
ncbi:MAG: cysteine-rich CWC family protein [Ginsengibacter sp.]